MKRCGASTTQPRELQTLLVAGVEVAGADVVVVLVVEEDETVVELLLREKAGELELELELVDVVVVVGFL